MKTTIDLPESVLMDAKTRAIERRTTLRELVLRGLQRELAPSKRGGRSMRQATNGGRAAIAGTPPPPKRKRTVVKGAYIGKIDLSDREAMARLFDRPL